MAERLVLHIGAMKTGTTFVQSVFNTNAEVLESHSVRYLGGRFGKQSMAVRDILNLPRSPRRNRQRWKRLTDELSSHPAKVGVVSMEFLSFAGPRHLQAFFEPLADVDVDVVLTVRDFYRVVPAQWQTYTRNFGTADWNDYQRSIAPRSFARLRPAVEPRAKETFGRAQDIETILERWSSVVPRERISLVTVPGPDSPRDLLWRRFCEAAHLPEIEADLSQTRDNSSVGYASCDLLRRVNEHLTDVPAAEYRNVMRPMINEVLAPLRANEGKPTLNRQGAAFAAQRNAQLRNLLVTGGYRWLGELADLSEGGAPSDFARVSEAPAQAQVRAAGVAFLEALHAGRSELVASAPLGELVAELARTLRSKHGWD